MNFYDYQIQLIETKRKELLTKANAGLSSQDDLAILKEAKELLILENKLKDTNKLKQEKHKELTTILEEKQRLSKILTELKDLKTLLAENKEEIIEKQQYTLSKLSKLLPIEEKEKENINKLESKLKSLIQETNEFFESHQTHKTTEPNNSVLLEKVSQILNKPVIDPIDAI